MGADHFDDLLRSLIARSSRRGILGGLASVVLGLASAHRPGVASAKKRKKKLQRNEFGCVNVGGKCRGKDSNCCSGICQGKKPKPGKKDKSRCLAHDTGGCAVGLTEAFCDGTDVFCQTTGGIGTCNTTTGNAAFCTVSGTECTVVCAKDADCRSVCGPNAACVKCPSCDAGTACVGPDLCV